MRSRIREDVAAMVRRDPAARSVLEVLLCYPGLHAVWLHRIAHAVWRAGFALPARLLSQTARFLTGVEIHPGTEIGRRCTIDHGAGVVIGETAEIGDDVHMYHGVTLGGDSPEPEKRHPTVEDGAVIGANATLIGDITVGEDASVGAGAVVVESVPAGATVVGNPAKVVDRGGEADEGRSDELRDGERSDEVRTDAALRDGSLREGVDERRGGDGTAAEVDDETAAESDRSREGIEDPCGPAADD